MGFQLKIVTYGDRFALALNQVFHCDICQRVSAGGPNESSKEAIQNIQNVRGIDHGKII